MKVSTPHSPGEDAELLEEIVRGLQSPNKSLPSKLLYDATGSALFRAITELPEYYLTRTERQLLTQHGREIVAAMPSAAGRERALVEFGASDESKALSLLDVADSHFSRYVAIDISPSVLGPLRARLQRTHPQIAVVTRVADFMQPFSVRDQLGDALAVGFFPGSTIGQYEPQTVVQFLENVRRGLHGTGPSAFVIGTDQCQDPARLLPAYNDSVGVSRDFTLNLLAHVNVLTGAAFDLHLFGHEAIWNRAEERIEIYLRSLCPQEVTVAGHLVRFAAGEKVRTGMSYKYAPERFAAFAASAGWTGIGFWQDSEALFGIHLLQSPGGDA